MKKSVVISIIVLIICGLLIPASIIMKMNETIIDPIYSYTVRTSADNEETSYGNYFDFETAKASADEGRVYGYKVYDKYGEVAYEPNGNELVSAILREGKFVADYIRDNGFTYGDAPVNPAINHDAKKVSCDRLVGWVLYRVGQADEKYADYLDQPETQGIVVYRADRSKGDFVTWCELHNFEKITDLDEVQAGDVVFVNPQSTSGIVHPGHVFICGGPCGDGNFYRYDAGSDNRIRSPQQPFVEPINNFMYAYRPKP